MCFFLGGGREGGRGDNAEMAAWLMGHHAWKVWGGWSAALAGFMMASRTVDRCLACRRLRSLTRLTVGWILLEVFAFLIIGTIDRSGK